MRTATLPPLKKATPGKLSFLSSPVFFILVLVGYYLSLEFHEAELCLWVRPRAKPVDTLNGDLAQLVRPLVE